MKNILLIEPDYKSKYPPIGLMKISYFHKFILHDYVRFTKGKLPEVLSSKKWDHIYVTSLFTFEWAKTIEAIEYAKTLVETIDQITVGGIAATLLPDQIYEETGIHPICGLLNKSGTLGIPGDECLDEMIPDYSMLNDTEYIYPFHDAYFLSATKGCGMKCGFCAVQTLEPTYIPYLDIKTKIEAVNKEFGEKRDLLLMDNNVLKSNSFNEIIDDIIKMGFYKGATYKNPKTGKTVRRYVDFNQGLDGNLLSPNKAKRLGEIALRPARIAFDHIEDKETYEQAFRRCAENGITELSNYILYNSESFKGKGQTYRADRPSDLYNRMRITLDLKDEINLHLPKSEQISAFSFPMRYIPLSAHERGYVGSEWCPKFLRAIQCMCIPAQGKGVGTRSFFEADFGKDEQEFFRFICMPEKLIAARGKFSTGGRGHSGETNSEAIIRKEKWNENRKRIFEWNRLYDSLGNNRNEFVDTISDNEFLPEKFFRITCENIKKLYIHYLTEPRLLALLGMISTGSPTYTFVHDYLTIEFPVLYQSLLSLVTSSELQQQYIFKNFITFFGYKGLKDILVRLENSDFDADKLLAKWSKTINKSAMIDIDFELIRVYRRYVELNVFDNENHKKARASIEATDMNMLASILSRYFNDFKAAVRDAIEEDIGKSLLNQTAKVIFKEIQMKLSDFLGDQYE